ncbi:hypothetical protein FHU41_001395 [Psychromicrobium silvestre]|uniref:Uncharacterized protein n=1 Tax=Psychromicrobium silvestre TaxID=1645614 RepID=A0A7Y9LT98_9MICC|nr:hypothetical protein [Psychromicrobium silvestre]
MNVPLNTSVFLAIAVALWLIWVGPYVLRLRKVRTSAVTATEDLVEAPASLESVRMSMASEKSQPREAAMTGTFGSNTSARASAKPVEQKTQAFKVRYGRTAIAAVGALALLTALFGLVLRFAGLASTWLPIVSVLIFALCLGSLRFLAVSDRKKRVENAFREAMSAAPIVASKPLPQPEVIKETKLFDAQPPAAEAKPVVKPLSAAELRKAALAVAEGAEVKADGTWEPVPVPKPSYVEAAKVERPAPAPLELPEAPKPAAKTSIKQSEAGVTVPVAKPTETTGAALNNLDDVLQRRRA